MIALLSKALQRARKSQAARRRGDRWEKVTLYGMVRLIDGDWSALNGGQVWERRDGGTNEYRQDPLPQ